MSSLLASPKPWYRSTIFWGGLLGFGSLIALWVDTTRVGRELNCQWRVGASIRGLGFHTDPHQFGGWVGRPYSGLFNPIPKPGIKILSSRVRLGSSKANAPGPWEHEVEGSDRARFRYFIDLWFIALCYLLLWIGGLVWWQRRRTACFRSMEALERDLLPPSPRR